MIKQTDLTIVVPVYNEAGTLPLFLPELIAVCKEKGWKAVLVNDGSTDGSAQCLSSYQGMPFVKIIHHKVNRGYGGALKSGILNSETSHVVTIDGDGQHSLADIETIFHFSLERDADLVVGFRGIGRNSNLLREFGKWLIRTFTRLLMPLPVHDLNSGFKLYRTELAKKYLPLCPNSMAFSDVITLAFISQRDLVLEHPITIRQRQTGKSKIGLQTAFETIIEIINIALLFNPLRVFLPISILSMLVGLGWGIPIILLGRGVSVGAMLAIVLGALFFAIGLIASQLSAMRIEAIDKNSLDGKRNG